MALLLPRLGNRRILTRYWIAVTALMFDHHHHLQSESVVYDVLLVHCAYGMCFHLERSTARD
jgi:hypothetical protein